MIPDQDFKNFQYNVLGPKTKVTGDLHLSGETILTAEVHGNITMGDLGKLTLERGSFVKGSVHGQEIDVFGTVEGEIISSGLVSVRSSARITGKIESKKLVIYPGAIIETTISSQE